MSRALTVQRAVVTPNERDPFVDRLRARLAHYRRAGCRYWVFEDAEAVGSFIEFIEGADASALEAALAGAPEPVAGARIYQELALD